MPYPYLYLCNIERNTAESIQKLVHYESVHYITRWNCASKIVNAIDCGFKQVLAMKL